MNARPDFAAHRAALLDRLAPDEAVLLFGSPHVLRNGDAEYRYRPHSDLHWLSGWPDPEVAVFLRPGAEPFVIFCQEKDPERETWTGFRPGPEGALADYGADAAFPITAIERELPRLLQGVSTLHYAFGEDHDHDALLVASIRKAARAARNNGLDVPETFHSPSRLLHELRLFKGADELALLRRAGAITGAAHRAAMAASAPGRSEREIEALVNWIFRHEGGEGPGYTTIVAGGANACILHYITNDRPLRAGDLLLLDAGCEYGLYTADVTRTWPVDGRFTAPQRDVYELVLASQLAAIEACRIGRTFSEVHRTAVRVLTQGMVDLGLLTGEVDGLIESDAYKKYYMHGTSHWLGMDVHDVGTYARAGSSRRLLPGMVLTIEPGLYIPAGDDKAPEALRGIGVRIEDDVLVTRGAPEILTDGIPKTVAELEEACAAPSPLDALGRVA